MLETAPFSALTPEVPFVPDRGVLKISRSKPLPPVKRL